MGIEGESTRSKFSTVFMWIFAIGVGVVLGCVFTPNIPYIGNKAITELKNENKNLRDSIIIHNKNILIINEKNKRLEAEHDTLTLSLADRDSTIMYLHSEVDSVNNLINNQDSIIIKIYENQSKDINNVPNMDIHHRIEFFTDYFKSRSISNGR